MEMQVKMRMKVPRRLRGSAWMVGRRFAQDGRRRRVVLKDIFVFSLMGRDLIEMVGSWKMLGNADV